MSLGPLGQGGGSKSAEPLGPQAGMLPRDTSSSSSSVLCSLHTPLLILHSKKRGKSKRKVFFPLTENEILKITRRLWQRQEGIIGVWAVLGSPVGPASCSSLALTRPAALQALPSPPGPPLSAPRGVRCLVPSYGGGRKGKMWWGGCWGVAVMVEQEGQLWL